MNHKSLQTSQKLRGAYYTPEKIVKLFLKWSIDEKKIQNILEPSAGDGRFINNIVNINKDSNVTAIEIDENEVKKICPKLEKANFKIINDDFYNFYENNRDKKFDVIIGNPPYIRYQFLTEEQRKYQSGILINNKLKPNKLINAWMAFTVAALELLALNGKIAFVLPTDIFQVTYAKQLRKFLFNSLKEITIINFKKIIFEETQQDVILLLGVKKESQIEKSKLSILNLNNLDELTENLNLEPTDFYEHYETDKWTIFKLENNFRKYYQSNFLKATESFNKICKTEVGITTGNNDFFVISNEKVLNYNLSPYVIPVIGRSVDVSGIFYSKSDLEKNIKNNNKIWLLDFSNKKINEAAKKYLDNGIEEKQNIGYKLSIREKWYEVPSIWKPEAFLLRRIGKFPKLLKNEISAVSTDTFHRIKLIDNYDIYKLLFLFYSSPVLLSFELEGRVFGGGALEILPGDLKNIRIPIIEEEKLNYKKLAEKLDEKLRKNIVIEEIVKWVDEQIASVTMFSKDELLTIYNTWLELNKKRY